MEHQQAIFTVPGMGSDHCAGIVRQSLQRRPGVAGIDTSLARHRVTVRVDPSQSSAADLTVIGNSLLLKRATIGPDR